MLCKMLATSSVGDQTADQQRGAFEEASKVESKAVPLHAMKALGGKGGIAPTHSRPRH
jgi:hypothetical protein